jgi:3'(2'), 5'-bisphosphate nucleotidase
MLPNTLLDHVVFLAQSAGQKILEVYHQSEGVDVKHKSDNSPVTAADLAAHAILQPGLEQLLTNVPVLSEESHLPPYNVRKSWKRYWIIDPLDGTKEFLKRNGEFTVNIALIEDGVPVLGVVHVPVLAITYTGLAGAGAYKIAQGEKRPIQTRSVQSRLEQKLPVEVVASRSHGADAVDRFLQKVTATLGPIELKNMGSSLKLCLVAEGAADIYPRLALTSEWDTAAAQAIVEAAGGKVLDIDLQEMRYNQKDDILNPFFYVIGDTEYGWEDLLEEQ